jgi:hypothetical protein
MVMDIQKLRTEIFDKTGIRVDASDPIFTLVALNEAVLEESIAKLNQAQEANNGELDERIGKLVVLHRNILAAIETLTERANHVHKAAALKAATDARAEILEATQAAMNEQVRQAVSLIKDAANELGAATGEAKEQQTKRWLIATVQAVIGGIVAGSTVLIFMHFMR